MQVDIKVAVSPKKDNNREITFLNESTIKERKNKLIKNMRKHGFSSLVIYADKEHGSNFEYLAGFVPRFEEGLQVFNVDGTSTLILGNENFNKVKFSRHKSEGIKCSLFSLPNQPMQTYDELVKIFKDVNLDDSNKIGIVGWKMIPEMTQDFDVPSFIVNALTEVYDQKKFYNGTFLYISPIDGARITNNANELAHYEYGASLASDGVLDAMNQLEVGLSELEAGETLNKHGQYNTVVSITSFGERFELANLYPQDRNLEKGDKVALTVAYRGGLSSRTGYAVESFEEMESADKGYIEEVVLPYFDAYYFWLKNIKIGKNAGQFYQKFSDRYPQSKYGWELCPGHLTSNEEWMSSPFYEGSEATIQSGMIFQVDFIPIQEGHSGVSAESTIALADEALRKEIQKLYPKLWDRIQSRRRYIKEELNLELPEEVLPFTSTLAYYRPYMLNEKYAIVAK